MPQWEAHGGLPRTALFENVHGRFHNVSGASHANLAVQGDGCAVADLNGDGYPDIVVSTTHGADILWNDRNGTFTKAPLTTGPADSDWYAGVAVADVNGDARPDIVLAGYTDLNDPVPNAIAGFPTSFAGIRDLLFLNVGQRKDGQSRFREVGVQAGLEAARFSHGLGAVFLDYNGDGRPDLYIANDEDPNELYENVPWPGGVKADPAGLGFRFEERAVPEGVADAYAGMGVAAAGYDGSGRMGLFVTNSRREPSAAFLQHAGSGSPAFANARSDIVPALGTDFAGLGRLMGRPRELGVAGSRRCRGCDPGDEPGGGRGTGTRGRSPVRQDTAGEVRQRRGSAPCRGHTPERSRSRRSRCRQRRPDGHRRQHDRRPARAAPLDRPDRSLARGGDVPAHAGHHRHRDPSRRKAASFARCSPAAATCPPRIPDCTSASAVPPR